VTLTILTFRGHSDDIVCPEVDGAAVDEFYVRSHGPIDYALFEVSSGGGKLLVDAIYGRGATWRFAVAPVEEDEPLPPWPVAVSMRGYSAALSLTLPELPRIRQLYPEQEDDE